jgi:hypothetical protein
MHLRCIQSRSTRLVVGLLLLPALAVRVLVPPGFMPGTGADDAPTMQMCHGLGPLPASTQHAPRGDDPAPGRGQQQHQAPCVFAAAGAAAPPSPAAIALDVRHVSIVSDLTPDRVVIQKALHRAQAARAPPTRIPLT